MRRKPVDLASRPLDHRLQIDDESLVYGIVCGAEGVEGGCAGSVENPEHGEVLVGVSRHQFGECPLSEFAEPDWSLAERCPRATLIGLMDAREERLARNETLFRSVNENIEKTATSGWPDEQHTFEFFCECSNIHCNLLLPMTLSAYEHVRADPKQFVVAPGHELPEIETVVFRTNSYQVVIKQGGAAELATERDPRSE